MPVTIKHAVTDLGYLAKRIQLMAQLTIGADPDVEDGDDLHHQRIALSRGSLAIMFVEISDEVERIRDTLKEGAI